MRAVFWLLVSSVIAGCGGPSPPPAVGTLERDRVTVSADYAEPIAAIAVDEGATVIAGDVLIRLEPARLQARVAQSQAELDVAQARLAELERGPREEAIAEVRAAAEGAEADLVQARREYARVAALYEEGLISASERDRAQRAQQSALARHREVLSRLAALVDGTTAEELAQARARVRATRAVLAEREVDLARLTLRAPVDGRVDALPFEVGERAPVGTPMAVMLSGPYYARVYIPAALRTSVRPGVKARVHVEGEEQTLPARVRYVSDDAAFTPYYALTEEDRGRLVYLAELVIESEFGGELAVGVPVQARFDDVAEK